MTHHELLPTALGGAVDMVNKGMTMYSAMVADIAALVHHLVDGHGRHQVVRVNGVREVHNLGNPWHAVG